MTLSFGLTTLLSLCGAAALSACTVDVPEASAPYTPTVVQAQYRAYTVSGAPAALPEETPRTMQAPAAALQEPGQASGMVGSPFVVRDLTIQKGEVGGEPRLLIEGDIVNVSSVEQTAAALYGKVLDSEDRVLRNLPVPNWSPVVILPGASLHFRIDTPMPPPPAARVRVTVGT